MVGMKQRRGQYLNRVPYKQKRSLMATHDVHCGKTTIRTTVTDKADTATGWVNLITHLYGHGHSPAVVGLGIDRRFKSHPPDTLHLCIGHNCLILQLLYMDVIPNSIKRFLMNPNFTFVGVQSQAAVRNLETKYGLDCFRFIDLREAVKAGWFDMEGCPGLKVLANKVIYGIQIERPVELMLGPWCVTELSNEQVEFASIGAFAAYVVGHKLLTVNDVL